MHADVHYPTPRSIYVLIRLHYVWTTQRLAYQWSFKHLYRSQLVFASRFT